MSAKDRSKIKSYVIARDGTSCCYCEKNLSINEITMEHIVPDSKRGTFNTTNLTVSCKPCNNKRGNIPFFIYIEKFDWDYYKIQKYKKLYLNNLKIKVLNIAKEELLNKDNEVPRTLINKACAILKIKSVDYSSYERVYKSIIDFDQPANKKSIKNNFQNLIKIIEFDSL